jgi:hypothetical protein
MQGMDIKPRFFFFESATSIPSPLGMVNLRFCHTAVECIVLTRPTPLLI